MGERLQAEMLEITADVVSSYVANNEIDASRLPDLIRAVHDAFNTLGEAELPVASSGEPAIPIEKSITPDFLICLEDGRKLKMLKRYLRARYDMTPDDYRAKWNLPSDYPMVAPNYAKLRSKYAKNIGLGKKKTG